MNLDEIDVSDTFDNIFNNLIKINSYYLNNYKKDNFKFHDKFNQKLDNDLNKIFKKIINNDNGFTYNDFSYYFKNILNEDFVNYLKDNNIFASISNITFAFIMDFNNNIKRIIKNQEDADLFFDKIKLLSHKTPLNYDYIYTIEDFLISKYSLLFDKEINFSNKKEYINNNEINIYINNDVSLNKIFSDIITFKINQNIHQNNITNQNELIEYTIEIFEKIKNFNYFEQGKIELFDILYLIYDFYNKNQSDLENNFLEIIYSNSNNDYFILIEKILDNPNFVKFNNKFLINNLFQTLNLNTLSDFLFMNITNENKIKNDSYLNIYDIPKTQENFNLIKDMLIKAMNLDKTSNNDIEYINNINIIFNFNIDKNTINNLLNKETINKIKEEISTYINFLYAFYKIEFNSFNFIKDDNDKFIEENVKVNYIEIKEILNKKINNNYLFNIDDNEKYFDYLKKYKNNYVKKIKL